MPSASPRVTALHAAYVRATGLDIPLTMDRECVWAQWVAKGWGPEEVEALVRHHRGLARAGKPARSLAFRSLAANIDYAEEDLAEITARRRRSLPQPNRESILRQTGRGPSETLPPPEPTAKPAKEAVASMLDALKRAVSAP